LVMDGTSKPSTAVTVTIAGAGGGGPTRGDNRRAPHPIYASLLRCWRAASGVCSA
jgi:hypothetical protein